MGRSDLVVMKREPVESSALLSVGYDPRSRILEVEFVSGEVYRYLGVGPADADALLRAESKGRYLNQRIKARYRYVRPHPPGG